MTVNVHFNLEKQPLRLAGQLSSQVALGPVFKDQHGVNNIILQVFSGKYTRTIAISHLLVSIAGIYWPCSVAH